MVSQRDFAAARSAAPTGPRPGDAFGAALLACWEAGAAPGQVLEFFERDDGYLAAGDVTRYFADPETWEPPERWACDQARGRVLDVGCGGGRHALHLQAMGRDVVALDISPGAADVCRRGGVAQVVTGTVDDLVASGAAPFDAFLMLGNNLGLLESAERAPRLLATLATLASPGAAILGQGLDPYQTDNPLHHAYHRRNRDLGRLAGQVRVRVRHQDLATPWFDYLFTSVDELRGLLAGSGWRLEHVESAGPRYVALLRRAG